MQHFMGNNFFSRSLVVCSLLSIIFKPYPIFQKHHRWYIGRRSRLECGSSWSACQPRMRQFVVGVIASNMVVRGRRACLECGRSWSACSPRMRQFVVGVLASNVVDRDRCARLECGSWWSGQSKDIYNRYVLLHY